MQDETLNVIDLGSTLKHLIIEYRLSGKIRCTQVWIYFDRHHNVVNWKIDTHDQQEYEYLNTYLNHELDSSDGDIFALESDQNAL